MNETDFSLIPSLLCPFNKYPGMHVATNIAAMDKSDEGFDVQLSNLQFCCMWNPPDGAHITLPPCCESYTIKPATKQVTYPKLLRLLTHQSLRLANSQPVS